MASPKGFSHIISLVVSIIRKLGNWKGIDKKQIKGIGIGVAGLVNSETGIVEFSPDFGWENVNVIKQLKKHISLPVFLDNSTRLMALGELEYGNKIEEINARMVRIAAQQNDANAIEIYNKAIDYLCIGLSDLVNLLDPETIFIGGGVSLSGDFYFDLLSKNIAKYLLSAKSKIPIISSTFKEYATAMGAVALVLNEILDFKMEAGIHQ